MLKLVKAVSQTIQSTIQCINQFCTQSLLIVNIVL